MNIKNLYIAYTFEKYLYKWLNKKEMIYNDDFLDGFITIEFLNKSNEYYIERRYWENKSIYSETLYKNRKRHGFRKIYYQNKILKSKVLYKNDEKNGIGRYYYNNGNLHVRASYKNGERYGITEWYNENGARIH